MKLFETGPEGCLGGTRVTASQAGLMLVIQRTLARLLRQKLNETRDAAGRLLAKGNILPSLIFCP